MFRVGNDSIYVIDSRVGFNRLKTLAKKYLAMPFTNRHILVNQGLAATTSLFV